jgi:hypothetical protein
MDAPLFLNLAPDEALFFVGPRQMGFEKGMGIAGDFNKKTKQACIPGAVIYSHSGKSRGPPDTEVDVHLSFSIREGRYNFNLPRRENPSSAFGAGNASRFVFVYYLKKELIGARRSEGLAQTTGEFLAPLAPAGKTVRAPLACSILDYLYRSLYSQLGPSPIRLDSNLIGR